MQDIDLVAMSLAELKDLRRKVEKAITDFNENRRKQALQAAETAAREHGFSLSDLSGAVAGTRRRKTGAPARYRHPEDPTLSWSGRGRRPQWIKDAVEDGKSLSDFEIGA